MFERSTFTGDKLGKDKKKKLYKQFEKIEMDLCRELKSEETADMIAIELEKKDGGTSKRHFMKWENIPLNDGYVKLEDAIEASAKFPDISLSDAVKKFRAENKEK